MYCPENKKTILTVEPNIKDEANAIFRLLGIHLVSGHHFLGGEGGAMGNVTSLTLTPCIVHDSIHGDK